MRFSCGQILILQQQLLIDQAGHEGQEACPMSGVAQPHFIIDLRAQTLSGTASPASLRSAEYFDHSGNIHRGRPWFHGPERFSGHVDHHFDYRHGYHGPLPARGERPVEHSHAEFRGRAMHDRHGREAPRGHR